MKNYSFIIPHHNTPDLLNRCLDSIPQREDIEIIVVDDNSDVQKRPQVTRPDVKLVYIDAEHTKGAGRARNYALKKATGRWLVFADADDFFTGGFLKVLDEYRDQDLEVVYYNAECVDSDTLRANTKMTKQWEVFNRCNANDEVIIKYHYHCPWYKMVKKDLIDKYKILFEEIPKGNDIQFTLLVAALASKTIIDKRKLYVYTDNVLGITHKHYSPNNYIQFYLSLKKINYFCKYINIPNPSISSTKFILRVTKREGLKNAILFLMLLLKSSREINVKKHDYVIRIEECKDYFKENNRGLKF